MNQASAARWVLSVCLLLSGAAGLIYEVLWSRQFALVMGQTVYALSTVISTFLGGLALGAWLAAAWLRRREPSPLLYAGMEVGIALSAALVPTLIVELDGLMGAAYRTWGSSLLIYSAIQLCLCVPVLLLPTVLMGATLPVATALIVRRGDDVTTGLGNLYGLNTLGGVAGAALAGFVLLPQIGMSSTGLVAVGLNISAALLALGVSRWLTSPAPAAPTSLAAHSVVLATAGESATSKRALWLALIYGGSGFASLVLEVAWARLVGLSIGSTTYGFSIILVTYIAGIGLGSLFLPRLRFLTSDPVRGLFLLHGVIALGSLLALGYLGTLPAYVLSLSTDPAVSAAGLRLREMVLVFSTIAVPTLAMGGAYPLVATLLHRIEQRPGAAAGFAYAANTAGNISGSLFAGFALIPLIGMRSTIVAAAALSGIAGIAFLCLDPRVSPRALLVRSALLATAIVAAAVWAPDWQKGLITSAPYATPKVAGEAPRPWAPGAFGNLIDYREGASTVVTVTNDLGAILTLKQDGLAEASSVGSFHRLLAHLPMLLHRDPKRVLLIGLGAGHTLDAVLMHPVERAEFIEISPEVRDVTYKYFNPKALDDPRARGLIGDGRNHLRHTEELYDVIISQPSQAWLSGAASLFTREYFSEVRQRLAPGGVACSWFTTYTAESRRAIVKAFTEVFPNAFLFDTQGLPTLLVGLRDDQRLTAANVVRGMRTPSVAADVAEIGFPDAADLLATLVTAGERLRAFTRYAPTNTDDNSFVAFHGVGEGTMEPFEALVALREDPARYIDPTLSTPAESAAFLARLSAAAKNRQADPFTPQQLEAIREKLRSGAR